MTPMSSDSTLPDLILASGSPRRRTILRELDVLFDAHTVDIDETPLAGETPKALVSRLSIAKAEAASAPGVLVLAADTIVALDGESLGKPTSPAAAREMLRRLVGRQHTVYTGVALHSADIGRTVGDIESSKVRLGPMNEEDIDWYIATGEPLDKAGSYAIQGLGSLFVAEISGNYSNVVGLPMPLTQSLFKTLGFDLRQFRSTDLQNTL